jgi:uncharacterized protein (DUF488 family)
MNLNLYTIGHSTHTIEKFIELLLMHSISTVCDVRSSPYSKFNPQFNRELLKEELSKENIAYVFLGKELGPRSDDFDCYKNGKVQYAELAKKEIFHQGLGRLKEGIKKYKVALMCSEKDPAVCHRAILICRHLKSDQIEIKHILEDGSIEYDNDLEKRITQKLWKKLQIELSDTKEDITQRAYDMQGERIAYVPKENNEDL